MSAVFTLEQVSTSPRFEFVAMRFRDQTPMVPYQTAFKILNGVCMAAKHAMRYEAVANTHWRTLAYIDVDTVTCRARLLRPAGWFALSGLPANRVAVPCKATSQTGAWTWKIN